MTKINYEDMVTLRRKYYQTLDDSLVFGAGYQKRTRAYLNFVWKIRIPLFIIIFVIVAHSVYRFGKSPQSVLSEILILMPLISIIVAAKWMRKIRSLFEKQLRYYETKELLSVKFEFVSFLLVLFCMIILGFTSHVLGGFDSDSSFNLIFWGLYWILLLFIVIVFVLFLAMGIDLSSLLGFPKLVEREEFVSEVPSYTVISDDITQKKIKIVYLLKFGKIVMVVYLPTKSPRVKLWIVDLVQEPGFEEVFEKLEKGFPEKRVWVEE